MKVKCNEESITIMGEGFRINIDAEEGLKLASRIQEYYFMEEEDDD